jgi:hypothetical protein
MLIVVLEGDDGVGEGENLEAVKVDFGALGGVQVEGLGGVEGAIGIDHPDAEL